MKQITLMICTSICVIFTEQHLERIIGVISVQEVLKLTFILLVISNKRCQVIFISK